MSLTVGKLYELQRDKTLYNPMHARIGRRGDIMLYLGEFIRHKTGGDSKDLDKNLQRAHYLVFLDKNCKRIYDNNRFYPPEQDYKLIET